MKKNKIDPKFYRIDLKEYAPKFKLLCNPCIINSIIKNPPEIN
jgi:hypothetical protein